VLFALLAEARKVTNAELHELIGIRLYGKERHLLNDLKLVESEKRGRVFVHELSDAGWQWCADELIVRPGPGGSLERSHYLLFGVFARYLSAARVSLAEVVRVLPAARAAGRHVRRDADPGLLLAPLAEAEILRLATKN
jgi:hypothetical protein